VQQFDSASVSTPVVQKVNNVGGEDMTHSGAYAAQLNASPRRLADGTTLAPQPLGPLTQLGVQKGDVVQVTAPGMYPKAASSSNFFFSLASFVAGLLQPPAPGSSAGGERRQRGGLPLLQVGLGLGLSQVPQLGNVPKGYLRVLVFNRDSVLVRQHLKQLSAAALHNYEDLTDTVQVNQDGYVTVYVGNDSPTDVFFDDVKVNHQQGLLVQENQYEPWGLSLAGLDYSTLGTMFLNKNQYNSKELQTDLSINWSDYGARMYDAQIGRWHAPDPMGEDMAYVTPYCYALNSPVILTDPDGLAPVYNWSDRKYYDGGQQVDWQHVESYLNNNQDGNGQDSGGGGKGKGQVSGGLTVVNTPGICIRKTNGHYEAFNTADGAGDASVANDVTELVAGFTPLGTAIDISTAISGRDFNGNAIPIGWRIAGLIPLVSEVRSARNLGKISRVGNNSLKMTLPAWKKVAIDIEHIASGHMKGGSRVSSNKTLFPDYMSTPQVEATVRSAYQNVLKRVSTQGERMLLQGTAANGIKVEMWLNNTTRTIETAYPIH
jgi:RHS repeat-associated protein